MRIAWGITGAGHYLLDSYEVIRQLVEKKYKIDVFFSEAGKTVAKMYGVLKKIQDLHEKNKEYLTSIFYDSGQSPGYIVSARFNLNKYDALIISPVTSNSIAKMNVGIADTLITNIFSQMIKGGGNILLVPCDLVCGDIETEIPNGDKIMIKVDQFNCQNALNLRKFPNVSLFEHPKEIVQKLIEFENADV